MKPASSSSDRSAEPSAEVGIQEVSTRRRALLKAGWMAPLILTVMLPKNAFAQYQGGGGDDGGGIPV
jgi:hypothetical protein